MTGKRWKRSFNNFIRKANALERYDVGLTVKRLATELNVEASDILKLNSNENFFIPLSFLRKCLMEVVEELDPRIYPRDELIELRQAIARLFNLKDENLVVGAGSDQLIELIVNAFLTDGDNVMSIDPTFVIYRRAVRTRGCRFITVPLKRDFSIDTDSIIHLANKAKAKLLFLCSPNNPTANQFDEASIRLILEEFDGMTVIDETYADFARYSVVDWIKEYSNLVVLRTFSKVFGIAGLRLGYAISNMELALALRERFKMPYAVSSVALLMGLKLLGKLDFIMSKVDEAKKARSELIERLEELDKVEPFPSETNFVLFRLNSVSSNKIYRRLLMQGVIVRNLGRVLSFDNCLRVTVAPQPMMERFVEALEVAIEG